MTERQPVSKITHQCNARVMYRVASKKSKKGGHHTVEFTKYGKRDCSCIGHNFLEKKGEDMFKDCRHKKMNTMYTRPGETRHQLELMAVDAMIELTRRGRPATNAWGWIYCQFPKYYNPIAVHCTGCPLYPTVCNIHKIRVPGKRNKLPLIWKLQGQIYAGHKKEAAKILRKIIKEVMKYQK